MDSTEAIEKAAGDWLARRDSGAWSDAERAAFERWLNTSALHRVAFLRVENAWEQALRLKALGAGVPANKVPPPGQWFLSPFDVLPSVRRRTSGGRIIALAAVAGIAAVMIGAWFLRPVSSYRTPVGGVASVPLSDGSTITLNTDSRVEVSVTERERRVNLQQGEAFFEVAKDPHRPFVVQAGSTRVVAVGTRFSVRREGAELHVVVTEGGVRMESDGDVPLSPEPLRAGAVARTGPAGVWLQYTSVPQAEEALSWRNGVLVFREMTLAQAAAEFNRYNASQIIIEGPALEALRVSGSFRSTNVQGFLRLIEKGYPLRVEHRGERIVLKGD